MILSNVSVTSSVLPMVTAATLKGMLVVLKGLPADHTRISSRHDEVLDKVMGCSHSTI